MNGKKCKKLRRAAESHTVGRPAVAYTEPGIGPQWMPPVPLTMPRQYYSIKQVLMVPCTRLVYKELKRNV